MMQHFEVDPTAPKSQARREFLKALSVAATTTLGMGSPQLIHAMSDGTKIIHPRAKADSVIVLWMGGGMGAPDTFDPKHYEPFEVGKPVAQVLSTFPSIPTVVDNIEISQGLENIAKVMDRATLIRSHVQPDLGSILHSRHQYHWHTGYVHPKPLHVPTSELGLPRFSGPTIQSSRLLST
jgi:hypothetical protein